jgi:hypothetical protein
MFEHLRACKNREIQEKADGEKAASSYLIDLIEEDPFRFEDAFETQSSEELLTNLSNSMEKLNKHYCTIVGVTTYHYQGVTTYHYQGVTTYHYQGVTTYHYQGVTTYHYQGITEHDTPETRLGWTQLKGPSVGKGIFRLFLTEEGKNVVNQYRNHKGWVSLEKQKEFNRETFERFITAKPSS